MGRMPVPLRVSALPKGRCLPRGASGIIRRFHRLSRRGGLVAYALRTRPPLSPAPKGRIPYDLHVLGLPLAFILSQDQTLRCSIVLLVSILNLGFRFRSKCVPFPVSASRLHDRCGPFFLCWPQAFKELCASFSPSNQPLFFEEADCKGTTFLEIDNQKNQLFLIICYIIMKISYIK